MHLLAFARGGPDGDGTRLGLRTERGILDLTDALGVADVTPAGVGRYHDPPRYLKGGDLTRCDIEGIGVLENPIVDAQPRSADHVEAAGVGALAGR